MTKLMDLVTMLEPEAYNLQILFVKRNSRNYVAFKPNIDESVKSELFQHLKDYIKDKAILGYDEIAYNPCKNVANTFTYCSHSYVGSYQELINAINAAQEDTNSNTEDQLTFYCLECTTSDNTKIYFMRNIIKYKALQKRGFLGAKIGNSYSKIEEMVIGVDGAVDLICTPNEIIILNYASLDKVFRLSEEFERRANEVLDIIQGSEFIENFEDFKNDCSTSKTHKMLAKLSEDTDLLSTVLRSTDKVRDLINRRNLGIDINCETIVYSEKEQLIDVIRLLKDSFYRTEIAGREGVDE